MDLHDNKLKANALQRRLGDYLLLEGSLTHAQLDEAIEHQCIYGSRLGTSLVELGYITEEHLAKILSEQLKLHYIKPELLMNVSQEILDLVPAKIANKYSIVPYQREGRRLFLAMRNATNLSDIDELSFVLNHIIVPLAIPEIRLMLALKKHYGHALSPRFEALAAQLLRQSRPAGATRSETKLTAKSCEKKSAQEDSEDWPLLGAEINTGGEADMFDDAYFHQQTPPSEVSYTSLSQQLVAASDRNDIARAIISYLAQQFKGSALLMVRGTTIGGWMASANGVEPDGFDRLNISLNEHSVFNLIGAEKTPYLGPVTETPQNAKLLKFFGTAAPSSALVMPLTVRDRVVSFLYVQDQRELLDKHFTSLQNIARKAEMCFTMLILKNKILTT